MREVGRVDRCQKIPKVQAHRLKLLFQSFGDWWLLLAIQWISEELNCGMRKENLPETQRLQSKAVAYQCIFACWPLHILTPHQGFWVIAFDLRWSNKTSLTLVQWYSTRVKWVKMVCFTWYVQCFCLSGCKARKAKMTKILFFIQKHDVSVQVQENIHWHSMTCLCKCKRTSTGIAWRVCASAREHPLA